VNKLEDGLRFGSVSCELRLAEVYDRVSFPPETSGDPDATGDHEA